MVGTSTCWGVALRCDLPFGLVSFPYVVNDTERIYSFGGSATTGALAKRFKEEFADSEESVGRRQATHISSSTWKLKKIPQEVTESWYFLISWGERSPIWDPFVKGVFFGVTLVHTRAHMYKALMEGMHTLQT
ncbi:FGGY-family carbohydrate kinase [Mesotoga sp.]|uniref:FGGY-family carbohydrate kinase n=1 Tax=Mesotoga sp. TaxID=2053577 RepID=UPI00345EA178